jgi:hypothetical protein
MRQGPQFLSILHQLFLCLPTLSDIWRSLPTNDAEHRGNDALGSIVVTRWRHVKDLPGFSTFHTYRQKVWESLVDARLHRADRYLPKLFSAPNDRALGQRTAAMCRVENDPDWHTIQTPQYLKLWWSCKWRGYRTGVTNRFEEIKFYFRTCLLLGRQKMTQWILHKTFGNIAKLIHTLFD